MVAACLCWWTMQMMMRVHVLSHIHPVQCTMASSACVMCGWDLLAIERLAADQITNIT